MAKEFIFGQAELAGGHRLTKTAGKKPFKKKRSAKYFSDVGKWIEMTDRFQIGNLWIYMMDVLEG